MDSYKLSAEPESVTVKPLDKTWRGETGKLTPEDLDERDESRKENIPFVLAHRKGAGLRFQ